MKKFCCLIVTALLLLGAAPQALAVCYPTCEKYDIWSRCYVQMQDRRRGSICADATEDGICDGCRDRLYCVDPDENSRCEAYEDNACIPSGACAEQKSTGSHHGGGGHHGGGKHHRR